MTAFSENLKNWKLARWELSTNFLGEEKRVAVGSLILWVLGAGGFESADDGGGCASAGIGEAIGVMDVEESIAVSQRKRWYQKN